MRDDDGASDEHTPTVTPDDEALDASAGTAPSSKPIPADLVPTLKAGLLLAALPILAELGFPAPKAKAVIGALGVSRAHAYEVRGRVHAALAALQRPVGRPPRPSSSPPPPDRVSAVAGEVRDFLLVNPGAAGVRRRRRWYSDGFRHFVLDLHARNSDLDLEAFATAVAVPLRTLSDWRRSSQTAAAAPPSAPAPAPAPSAPPASPPEPARHERIQTVLDEWVSWKGHFVAFCGHVQTNLRIPYGRTQIAAILEAYGVRPPRRRSGRSPDERALRDAFETFFPGAQWSADGTPINVEVAGQTFTFNLELVLDPASGAVGGESIRAEEDGAAVVEAFDDAVRTTGSAPLALLLDNRPSNHTDEVAQALDDHGTARMRSTSGRPQNKAHSEGAFGLLSQVMPPLSVPSVEPEEIARAVLALVVTSWARTLNHKPRTDRNGKSRADLYAAADPTPEEVERARRALEERTRKQEQARQTLASRQDPVVRQYLDQAFALLALDDPEAHVRTAIARYGLDHVVAGVAVFEGRKSAGTLPRGVDARYLLGIVRRLAEQDEVREVASALWRGRLAARDAIVLCLDADRARLAAEAAGPGDLARSLTDRVTAATRRVDRFFWIDALGGVLAGQPASDRRPLFDVVVQRVKATHAITLRERHAVVRRLADLVLPLG